MKQIKETRGDNLLLALLDTAWSWRGSGIFWNANFLRSGKNAPYLLLDMSSVEILVFVGWLVGMLQPPTLKKKPFKEADFVLCLLLWRNYPCLLCSIYYLTCGQPQPSHPPTPLEIYFNRMIARTLPHFFLGFFTIIGLIQAPFG